MKVCVPTMGDRGLDEEISPHFGRALTFTIVDLNTNDVRVIPNRSTHMGGTGLPSEAIAAEGVDAILVGNLGPKAVLFFEQAGINVCVGATGTVRSAIDAWKAGCLAGATPESACREHKH